MRTTVTLEPNLIKKIRALANRQGTSFKRVLNDVIRRGLASPASQSPQPRYSVEPHAGGFRAGIDPAKLNQLVDQLEVEDFVSEVSR